MAIRASAQKVFDGVRERASSEDLEAFDSLSDGQQALLSMIITDAGRFFMDLAESDANEDEFVESAKTGLIKFMTEIRYAGVRLVTDDEESS